VNGPALNPWLEERLERLAGDGPVLDLGCGRGYWMRHMAERGIGAVGVEHDHVRAVRAGRHGPVVSGDGAHLPLADASVGLVWCLHVLHHLPDPTTVLTEVRRVLRPGGSLVLAESVEDNPLLRLGRRLHASWDGVGIHARFTATGNLDRRAWHGMEAAEARLPAGLSRFGAHLECVARRPS
jgi:SAM-dependent methyltransferase